MQGLRRTTYHIQCLFHEAVMNLPLGSQYGILRFIKGLSSWWQAKVILIILLGFVVASGIGSQVVEGIGDVAERGFGRSSVCSQIVLGVSIHCWRGLRQRDFGIELFIGADIFGTVRVLDPGVGRSLALQLALHACWVAVLIAVLLLLFLLFLLLLLLVVAVIVVEILIVGSIVATPIPVLVVVLPRIGGEDVRCQEVGNGLEDANNERDHSVEKPRNPST